MKSHGNRRLVLCLTLALLSGKVAQAADEASYRSRSPAASDEYNFSWLDPDKKIYVLQNRRYTKAGRALLSGMLNTSIAQPYRNSYGIDARAAYYFSEMWGLEAFYGLFSNSQNSTDEALAA